MKNESAPVVERNGEVSSISNPERWARHVNDRDWHRVVAVDASVATACRGRWSTSDDFHLIERRPANASLCAACQRPVAPPGVLLEWLDDGDPR